MSALSQEAVFAAITIERQRQKQRWGATKPQSLPGYILLADKELGQAKTGYADNLPGRHSPLSELLQAAAVIVAALEQYGTEGSAIATNDIVVKPVQIELDPKDSVGEAFVLPESPAFSHTELKN